MARGMRKSSPPLPGCNTVCAEKWLQRRRRPPDIFPAEMRLIWVWLCMQTMCGPLESSGGDSQISWLIALIPGLSLVILRQIIQDYDLMGCVKSAGKHKQEWGEGGPFERISAANCSSNSRCASWRGWPGADSVSKGGCLTPRASNVPHV